jgi:hypothetical protein
MTRFFYLSQRRGAVRSHRSPRRNQVRTVGAAMIHPMFWGLILIGGVTYLLQMNSLATGGYQIQQLQRQLAEAQQVTNELKLQALALQSVDSVEERMRSASLVAVGQPEFVEQAETVVAKAR